MAKDAKRRIVVWGGAGFVGRHLLPKLAEQGFEVVVAGRSKSVAGYGMVKADITNAGDVKRALAGAWGVVNLVGILAERGRSFEDIQLHAVRQLAKVAVDVGVERLVHVSAAGVSAESGSRYARSKALAEVVVREVFPTAQIVKPGLILGEGSGFAEQLEQLTRFSPMMPLMGGGGTKFKPVMVEDVVRAIVESLTVPKAKGGVVVCEGAREVTFRQLATEQLKVMGRTRVMVPVPWWAAEILARVIEKVDELTAHRLVPWWAVITRDQLVQLRERS